VRSITNQVVMQMASEAQVLHALQALWDRIRQARRAELVMEGALEDESEPESKQQAVQVIQLVETREHEPLDHHTQRAHDEWRDDERPPVPQPRLVQQEVRHEGADHVLGAVGEVDDVQEPEDDREPQGKERVERPVDQADQQLPEECLGVHRSTRGRYATSQRSNRHP
jgi:hypothetical protein